MAIVLKNPRFSGLDQDPASPSYGSHISGALTGYALYSPSTVAGDEVVPAVVPQIPAIILADTAAGGADVDIVVPYACRLLFVLGYKVGAGDAGCQVEVFNGSDLIGTIDCDATANQSLSMGDRDATYADFAAGDTLTLTPTDAGTGDAATTLQLFVVKL
jgi:hypothetical protein